MLRSRPNPIASFSGPIVFLIFLFLAAAPLEAFVPHPLHMLDLMLAKPAKVKTVTMEQRIRIHGFDSETPSQLLQGTVYLQWPGGYRIESVGEVGHAIQLVTDSNTVLVQDGFIEPAPPSAVDFYLDLVYHRTRSAMASRLARLGIDVTTAGPGLWQNRPQWVLGAHYPDSGKSQLWIDKETFRPLGLQITTPGNPDYPVQEVRYLNWQQKNGFRYPRRIVFYQDQILLREIDITEVKINPRLARDLFDLEKLRSQYSLRPAQGTRHGTAGEVQQVIEDFNKIYSQ